MKVLDPNLVKQFNYLKDCSEKYYNHSVSMISDSEFDRLESELLEKIDDIDLKNTVFGQLHFPKPIDSNWEVKKHKVLCKSLEKIKYEDSEQGLNDYLELVEPITDELVVQLKYDGLTIECVYEENVLVSAILRGEDGTEGEDVYNNIKHAKGVKKFLPIGNGSLIAEIILEKTEFDKINEMLISEGEKPFKVVRNATSGIARNFDNRFSNKLTLKYFDVHVDGKEFETIREKVDYVTSLGLTLDYLDIIPPKYDCDGDTGLDWINNLYNRTVEKRESYNFEIDGIVLKPNTINNEYNSKGNKKFDTAWKFPNKTGKTKPVNVEWQYGKTGRVTPVLNYEPFELDGRTFINASIHNIVRFKELKLGMDSDVEIEIGGDIIPNIKSNTKSDTPFEIPTHCEHCGSELVYEQSYLYCRNMSCDCNVVGSIHNWFKKIGVKNVAESTIEKIVDHLQTTNLSYEDFSNTEEFLSDVKTYWFPKDSLNESSVENIINITSMYKLEPSFLMQIEGFKERLANKTISSIEKVKELKIGTFLGSLNIKDIGRRSATKLMETLKPTCLEDVFNYTIEDIDKVSGFAMTTATNFVDGVVMRKSLIEELSTFVKIDFTIDEVKESGISGKKICMTGTLPIGRNDFKKIVTNNGAKVASSVSKTTDYLVLGEGGIGTSKHTKAEENNINIISYEEFKAIHSL